MNTHADKVQDNKSQFVANGVSQKQSGIESTFQFADNRPEVVAQRKLQEMADNSAGLKYLMAFRQVADSDQTAKSQQIVNNTSNQSLQHLTPETHGCIQCFTMNSNGLQDAVSIVNEENGPHNGHTIGTHVITEAAAASRLLSPLIPAAGFWATKDDAHNAFKQVLKEDRTLKHWAGVSEYDPLQTRVATKNVKGGKVVTRDGAGGTITQKSGKVEGYIRKPNNNPFTVANPTKVLGLVTLYPIPE